VRFGELPRDIGYLEYGRESGKNILTLKKDAL
jgi:hypothetical protein